MKKNIFFAYIYYDLEENKPTNCKMTLTMGNIINKND